MDLETVADELDALRCCVSVKACAGRTVTWTERSCGNSAVGSMP